MGRTPCTGRWALGAGSAVAATPTPSEDASAVDQPEVAPNVEEVAADQIATKDR